MGDGSIFYNEMNWLLQTNLLDVRDSSKANDLLRRTSNNDIPIPTSPLRSTGGFDFGRSSITTPSGFHLSTPYASYNGDHKTVDLTLSDKIMSSIVERVNAAIEEKINSNGNQFSLLRQFQEFDNNTGYISFHFFMQILESLLVTLTSEEIKVLHHLLGRPEDEKIDYFRFCRMIEYASYTSGARYKRDVNGFKPYLSSKVIERYIQLKDENCCPKYLLSKFDRDGDGIVNVKRFRETLSRLDLLQNDYEMSRVLEDFANRTNKSMIHYGEFCTAIEEEAKKQDSDLISRRTLSRLLHEKDVERSLHYSQFTPQTDRIFNDNEYPPMKATESASRSLFERGRRYRRYGDEENTRIGNSTSTDAYWSHRRNGSNHCSPRRPRSPPCKVGVSMWGHNTPTPDKGRPLEVDHTHWCCSICYYTENPSSADKCELCDCPNLSKSKDYAFKEQCSNCTFLNGHFATECEMCSKPLYTNGNVRSSRSSDEPYVVKTY